MGPEDLTKALAPTFGDQIVGIEPGPGIAGKVRFRSGAVVPLLTAMRDTLGYRHLAMVGGIDWVDHREVFYVVWSDDAKQYAILTTDLPADHPAIESVTGIYPSANWHEREAWEMVDITFEHHPDLRHLLMPDGYQYHPLLRSFKLHEPEDLEVKVRNV